jgi:DNA polymerase alpha subunit B
MQRTNKQPFSLFPGQVVAVEGMNGTGRKLTAHRILHGAPPPPKTTPVRQLRQFHYDADKQDGNPLKVMTACGPFTTSQNMDYRPLTDLMNDILEKAPDVVVLTGPFVDVRQPDVRSGKVTVELEGEDDKEAAVEVVEPHETVFFRNVSGLIKKKLLKGTEDDKFIHTQFVLVPAMEDATAKWV